MQNKPHGKQQAQIEVDTAFLYQAVAALQENESVKRIFEQMAAIEQGHARKWQEKNGGQLPQPSGRARFLAWIARRFGYEYVLPLLMQTEKGIAHSTLSAKSAQGTAASGSEWNHVAILSELSKSSGRMSGSELARLEGKHRSVGGNALRAAVLGANDGLVSNMSLIMGVAGADSSGNAIIVAGFAGLLAGSISMALGEWLSVQSSRELFQRQLSIEMDELENSPEEELRELSLIYQARGMAPEQAREMAAKMLDDKETAHHTLIREELGFDPEELGGSAWTAAFTSFALFAVGAIIPVIPYLFLTGQAAMMWSLGASTLGLFGIGAAITLFTGRGIIFSGFRQVLFGLAAAAVTFGIGKIIGVSV